MHSLTRLSFKKLIMPKERHGERVGLTGKLARLTSAQFLMVRLPTPLSMPR